MFNKRQKNQKFFSDASFVGNRKAQIGETMTWIVATLIIILILAVAIFVSTTYLGRDRSVKVNTIQDFLTKKSLLAYLLSESDGDILYNSLQSKKLEDADIEGLALKIFDKNKYWVGFFEKTGDLADVITFGYRDDDLFGGHPSTPIGPDPNVKEYSLVITEDKKILIIPKGGLEISLA